MWKTVLLTVFLSTRVNCFVKVLQNQSLSLSLECNHQMEELFSNFSADSTSWALKMVEASSDVPMNVFSLKYGDMGDFQTCVEIKGKYCLGMISSNESLDKASQVPTWALCVPRGCTIDDINVVGDAIFQKSKNISVSFSDILCQTIDDVNPKISRGAIAAIVVLGGLIIVVIGSTLYDIYQKNSCPVVIKGFSVYTNSKQIFSTSIDNLPCLNGLRCFSMLWVVALHQYTVPKSGTIVNPSEILIWYDHLRSMFLINGHLSVDTFLTVTGTLLSYSFMTARSKNKSFNLFLHYLHRYLRLTAPFSLVVLVSATLLKYMGSGPKWPLLVLYFQENCEQNWWSALLYVQNYVNVSKMCVGQTWYLDIDMQLHIISPVILLALWKYPKIAFAFLGVGILVAVGVPFYVSWQNELPAIISNIYSTHKNDYDNKYYLVTHTRCAPWIVGVILGFFIHKIQENNMKFNLNKLVVTILWILCLGTLLSCVLGGHGTLRSPKYDTWGNAFHIGLVRPVWSLAVAWIILACITGYAGPINWVLSLPVYQILNRFTYSIYLTHVTLLYAVAFGRKWPDYFSDFNMAYEYWGTLAFSSGLAILLVFVAECPVTTVERVLIESFTKKQKPQKTNNGKGIDNAAFDRNV